MTAKIQINDQLRSLLPIRKSSTKIFHHIVSSALLFTIIGFSSVAHAISVSGQGTWETTLLGRDLDGNAATFEAYYDTTLNITWLADANVGGVMNWADANAWAASLNINGVTGWRLPDTVDGVFDWSYGGTNAGYNVDTSMSEMASLFYDTLGNLAQFDTTGTQQAGSGVSNTGPFSNLQTGNDENHYYWSATEYAALSTRAWMFDFGPSTTQSIALKTNTSDPGVFGYYAWAVRPGDISAVPVPAAAWLFGSGLIGLIGVAKRKKV